MEVVPIVALERVPGPDGSDPDVEVLELRGGGGREQQKSGKVFHVGGRVGGRTEAVKLWV